MTAIEGVNDGMDQINHIASDTLYRAHAVLDKNGRPDSMKLPVLELDKEMIDTFKAHRTVLDPTMALFESLLNTVPLDQLEPGLDHVAPQLREALDNPPAEEIRAEQSAARWQTYLDTLRALHAAGIPIVAGTDQAIPGYSLHREIEIYVQAGFTPIEALQAATIEPARALGVEKESGSLEVGKRADVLLLDADPLADIRNTRRVWRTVAAEAIYEPRPLWESVQVIP